MKTFEQLTFEQKRYAIKFAEYSIIESVANGVLDITLVNPKNQELLEYILSKSRKNENPRLAKLYLLGEKSIREEICRLAIVAAGGSRYNRKGEPITKGVISDRETVKRQYR